MVVTWAYNAGTNTATASGAGSTNFAALVAADTAGGWGKYTADATGRQIICACRIIIGDATNACVFTDTNKQILFTATASTVASSFLINVRAQSTLTLGTLTDATLKTTSSGCAIINLCTAGTIRIAGSSEANSTINLYGCFITSTVTARLVSSSTFTMYDCTLGEKTAIGDCPSITVNNLVSSASDFGVFRCAGTFSNLNISKATSAAFLASSNIAFNAANVVANGNAKLAYVQSAVNNYLINCVADAWTFYWTAAGTVYRQYTFDLLVVDSAGTAINGATVTLKKADSTNAFSVSSAADGSITTQTVSRGYYAQATGDTLQDYGPFTLTISKTGYLTYVHTGIVLDEKIDWRISLMSEADAAALFPSTGGRGQVVIKYVDREVIKKVEVPTKKEKIALQLCGVLIAQKENMRRQNGE